MNKCITIIYKGTDTDKTELLSKQVVPPYNSSNYCLSA